MADFDKAFALVIGAEGGYVNDPRDPGGETNWGITKRDHPDVDIRALTQAAAGQIYAEKYWKPTRCDDLPWPLNALVFDAAVNQGCDAAVKMLQKAANVPQDGAIGNNTLAAIRKADQKELCALYLAARALRYTGTRNFDVYGTGWLKRIFKLAMEV
jgi:lysozyme family protein